MSFVIVGVVILVAIVLIICILIVTYWLGRRYKLSGIKNQVLEASYTRSACMKYVCVNVKPKSLHFKALYAYKLTFPLNFDNGIPVMLNIAVRS